MFPEDPPDVRLSKFLSYICRHGAEERGLTVHSGETHSQHCHTHYSLTHTTQVGLWVCLKCCACVETVQGSVRRMCGGW